MCEARQGALSPVQISSPFWVLGCPSCTDTIIFPNIPELCLITNTYAFFSHPFSSVRTPRRSKKKSLGQYVSVPLCQRWLGLTEAALFPGCGQLGSQGRWGSAPHTESARGRGRGSRNSESCLNDRREFHSTPLAACPGVFCTMQVGFRMRSPC